MGLSELVRHVRGPGQGWARWGDVCQGRGWGVQRAHAGSRPPCPGTHLASRSLLLMSQMQHETFLFSVWAPGRVPKGLYSVLTTMLGFCLRGKGHFATVRLINVPKPEAVLTCFSPACSEGLDRQKCFSPGNGERMRRADQFAHGNSPVMPPDLQAVTRPGSKDEGGPMSPRGSLVIQNSPGRLLSPWRPSLNGPPFLATALMFTPERWVSGPCQSVGLCKQACLSLLGEPGHPPRSPQGLPPKPLLVFRVDGHDPNAPI